MNSDLLDIAPATAADRSPSGGGGIILPIQALRGIAALMVAIYHILFVAGSIAGGAGNPYSWTIGLPWEAGVDVFFVISGFVIILASARLFDSRSAVPIFLARRFIRVVPLYWLATTALVVVLLSGITLHDTRLDAPAHVIASYLFIPWPRADGDLVPILSPGWTLNYEMTFYAVVASFLWLPRRLATVGILGVLSGATAYHFLGRRMSRQLWFITDPLILEFAFGILIATARLAGVRLRPLARWSLVILGIVALCFGDVDDRFLWYGVPAALIVAGAALGAERVPRVLAALCVFAGDVSYSLYLTHPFAMDAVRMLWVRLTLPPEIATASYVAAAVLASVATAAAINAGFEKPLMRRARRGNVAAAGSS